MSGTTRRIRIHPWPVRLGHWLNAVAIVFMIGSGLQIYNAAPIFAFRFPAWLRLGGWLGGGIAIHFAAMWLLFASALLYLGYGLLSGHLRRRLLPIRPREVVRDLGRALTFRLVHEKGTYNSVQRLLYLGVWLAIVLVILSGLSIWKPVQFYPVTWLMGGYDAARVVHFVAMASIAGFLVVHLALVALVPSTLTPMIIGSGRVPAPVAPGGEPA